MILSREIEKAVVFAILMENNRGVIDKAPVYMMEKWDAVKLMSEPRRLLDDSNMRKLELWIKKWFGEK